MVANNHYDDDALLNLLRRRVGDAEDSTLTHVESCTLCQTNLETLSQSGMTWNEVSDLLRPDEATPVTELAKDFGANDPDATATFVTNFLEPSDNSDSIGRFARFEIKQILGRGGMGIVMQALDTSLGRHCAVKVLAPELASSAAARKRFSREAKSAAAVVHPHVVPIQTVDEHNGLPYLVMPVVEGQSLQQRVEQDGPLSIVETVRIAAQVAEGLSAAHDQGLVHRDIKPANVLLENGVERVQITDFGLARAIDDASMTRSGVIAGTPQYMSPEQAHGDTIDHRSDLFSLGSLIYFMLAGRSPFRAETTMGVLNRIGNDDPRSIRSINADVPQWLDSIVSKLLSKSPEDRFQTAAEVAELLQACHAQLQQPDTAAGPAWGKIPACQDSKSASWKLTPRLRWLLATAARAFFTLAGVLIVLELNKGTLRIESELDGVPIRIAQGENVVEELTVTRDGTSTRIAAGKYVVKIEQPFEEAVISANAVVVSRGGTKTLEITRVHRDEITSVNYRVSEFLDYDSAQSVWSQLQTLISLIKTTIGPNTWNDNNTSIDIYPQDLSFIVRQRESIHTQIAQFIDQLRLLPKVQLTEMHEQPVDETEKEPVLSQENLKASDAMEQLAANEDQTDLPVFSGRNIREWFAEYRKELFEGKPHYPGKTLKAIEALRDHPANDRLVIHELETWFKGVENELNPEALDATAATIIKLAGNRHQSKAVELLFRMADLRKMPQSTGEMEWLGDTSARGVPVPFKEAVPAIARFDEALAKQFASEMTTSQRRVLVGLILVGSLLEDSDETQLKEQWMRDNANILLPAFVRGLDDPQSLARYYALMTTWIVRSTLEPAGPVTAASSLTRLPEDDDLELQIETMLLQETDGSIASLAWSLLESLSPGNATVRKSRLAWARSPEGSRAGLAMNSMADSPDKSIDELAALLGDPQWGVNEVDKEDKIERYEIRFTNLRDFAIAILGQVEQNKPRAIQLLKNEARHGNARRQKLAKQAIDAIEKTAVTKPFDIFAPQK